jgi:hypothetical protein
MRRILWIIKNILKYRALKLKKIQSIEKLVDTHFKNWSEENHINRNGLSLALNEICRDKPIVVETGTSAYGTDSSRLFDSLVRFYSGSFYSVDIDPSTSKRLIYQHSNRSHFYVEDSVNFLTSTLQKLTTKVDLFYLDSRDVDWDSPLESAQHGLAEFRALAKFIRKGTILVVDDTPATIEYIPKRFHKNVLKFQDEFGVLPGKGALIIKELKNIKGAKILSHEYNIVVKFTDAI